MTKLLGSFVLGLIAGLSSLVAGAAAYGISNGTKAGTS